MACSPDRPRLLLSAVAAAFMLAVQGTTCVWRRCLDWLGYSVLSIVATFKRDLNPIQMHRPLVVFVQARAFVMRMAKRERPVVTPRWRMCPSA